MDTSPDLLPPPAPKERGRFLVCCGACAHVWVPFWTPISLSRIPRRYQCPMCCDRNAYVVPGSDTAAHIRYRDHLAAELAAINAMIEDQG